MPAFNNIFPIPTGGSVGLSFTTSPSGAVMLSRATSGASGVSSFTPIYSGVPLSNTGEACFFLDLGDESPGPLLAGTVYVYQLADSSGTTQSDTVTTTSRVDIEQIQFTQIIIKLLQGAVNAAQAGGTLPNGIKWARVMSAMPLSGQPPLPSIFVNPDLIVQENVPIGLDDEKVGDLIQPATSNVFTQTQQDRHLFRITVIATSAEERDYYRDFIIAMLRISVAYAFSQFGADISHSYEAASYQEVDQTNLMLPGFYGADVLFDFTATANVKVTTSYGLIETITGTLSDTAGVEVSVQAPTL